MYWLDFTKKPKEIQTDNFLILKKEDPEIVKAKEAIFQYLYELGDHYDI